jgi:hypothetical protein
MPYKLNRASLCLEIFSGSSAPPLLSEKHHTEEVCPHNFSKRHPNQTEHPTALKFFKMPSKLNWASLCLEIFSGSSAPPLLSEKHHSEEVRVPTQLFKTPSKPNRASHCLEIFQNAVQTEPGIPSSALKFFW